MKTALRACLRPLGAPKTKATPAGYPPMICPSAARLCGAAATSSSFAPGTARERGSTRPGFEWLNRQSPLDDRVEVEEVVKRIPGSRMAVVLCAIVCVSLIYHRVQRALLIWGSQHRRTKVQRMIEDRGESACVRELCD